MLMPAFKTAGARMHTVVTSGGLSGVIHGTKTDFEQAGTDVDTVLADAGVNAIVIATRHDSHARLAARALRAGKHVFVEKPLAITLGEIDEVRGAYDERCGQPSRPMLMVGFNRRFAPQVQQIKKLLASVQEPKSFLMTMNAGAIPANHWTQDPRTGGGRIIGEACHFIDLMRFLADSPIVSVQARCMGSNPTLQIAEDKASIVLGFADGSFGTIMYLANGSASFPKERIEVFVAGRVLQLDNFRRLKGYGWPGFRSMNLWKQDKGQAACAGAFLDSIKRGQPAIAPEEVFEVARVTIEAALQLRQQ
jgi:predicted dehydrogenase